MLYCQGAFFNVASYGDGAWQVTKQWIPILHLGPPGQRIHFLGVCRIAKQRTGGSVVLGVRSEPSRHAML